MKLKLIALAAAALVSGAANAAIDSGTLTGNGNLLFTVWNETSSYTLNTGYTIDSFNAAVASGINYSFTDSTLSSWLSTAGSAVNWTIFAGDVKQPLRSITTSDLSNDGTLNNANAKLVNFNNANFIDGNLNVGAFANASTIDAVSAATDPSYTGTSSLAYGAAGYIFNFNSNGTLANNSAATGLAVISVTATNAAASVKSVYTPYTGVTAWIGSDNAFHIGTVAAVPEPESLAMLLAGIGLVGSIARRRNRAA